MQALVMQAKHEEALKILDEVTDKGPADESSLQAEAYVLQGNSLQAIPLEQNEVVRGYVEFLRPVPRARLDVEF